MVKAIEELTKEIYQYNSLAECSKYRIIVNEEINQELGVKTGSETKEEALDKEVEAPKKPVEKETKPVIDPGAYKENIMKVLKTKRLWLILFLAFSSQIPHGINAQTMRSLANAFQDSDFVPWLPNLKLIFYAISSFIFGQLLDKYGYKRTLFGYFCLSLLGALLLICCLSVDVVFDIVSAITGMIMGGGVVIFSFHIIEVYGTQYFIELNGAKTLFAGLISMIISIIPFIYGLKNWKTESQLTAPYRGLYIATFIISLIGFFLQFQDSCDEYDYSGAGDELISPDSIIKPVDDKDQ